MHAIVTRLFVRRVAADELNNPTDISYIIINSCMLRQHTSSLSQAINAPFVWGPNIAGAALGMVQLALVVVFRDGTRKALEAQKQQ